MGVFKVQAPGYVGPANLEVVTAEQYYIDVARLQAEVESLEQCMRIKASFYDQECEAHNRTKSRLAKARELLKTRVDSDPKYLLLKLERILSGQSTTEAKHLPEEIYGPVGGKFDPDREVAHQSEPGKSPLEKAAQILREKAAQEWDQHPSNPNSAPAEKE